MSRGFAATASAGSQPPFQVLNSAQEIWFLMPREVRTLVLGHMIFGGIETGKTHEALLAEGLARALRGANAEAETSIAEGQMGNFDRYVRIGDWIRETLDAADDEGIFGQVLQHYEPSLAEQSFEAVGEEVEELPSSVVVGLHQRLSVLLESEPSRPSPQGELFAIGQFLGAGLRQLYLGTIAYGAEQGIFRPEEFGITPEHLRDFQTPRAGTPEAFVLIDAEHLRNLRLFETVVDNLRRDWGRLHPTVRGFSQVYGREGWLDETGANRLRPLAEEVETFVTRPHH